MLIAIQLIEIPHDGCLQGSCLKIYLDLPSATQLVRLSQRKRKRDCCHDFVGGQAMGEKPKLQLSVGRAGAASSRAEQVLNSITHATHRLQSLSRQSPPAPLTTHEHTPADARDQEPREGVEKRQLERGRRRVCE
ncbi:Hypothetical predicted protein [Cloeon dipterum]|uniref:Uncharacterized protein n=1 Tax=Cloeon dipterum TaxID=197152 RepID=A0A8S1DH89_9INSE|nr:Hypothetical predicted protein [Cloeon dipterum]